MTIQTRPVKSTNGHHEQTVAHSNGANGSQRHGYAPHAYAREWRVIANLTQKEAVSVRDIFERVDMDKSKVSRAASRLDPVQSPPVVSAG